MKTLPLMQRGQDLSLTKTISWEEMTRKGKWGEREKTWYINWVTISYQKPLCPIPTSLDETFMILSIISSSECLHTKHRDTDTWPTIPLLSYENNMNSMDHWHNSSHNTHTHTHYCISCTSLKLPKHSPQLKNVSVVINRSCWLLRITDTIMKIMSKHSKWKHTPPSNRELKLFNSAWTLRICLIEYNSNKGLVLKTKVKLKISKYWRFEQIIVDKILKKIRIKNRTKI